jgi:rhodanese-related sulfurtransferase
MSKRLIKLGFSDVRTLRGGLTGWEDAGNKVVATD